MGLVQLTQDWLCTNGQVLSADSHRYRFEVGLQLVVEM
jgi:hypothetical protein